MPCCTTNLCNCVVIKTMFHKKLMLPAQMVYEIANFYVYIIPTFHHFSVP